jgi:hypothetical protein
VPFPSSKEATFVTSSVSSTEILDAALLVTSVALNPFSSAPTDADPKQKTKMVKRKHRHRRFIIILLNISYSFLYLADIF